MIKFTEKLAICYTCSGPSYRKSALKKITEEYFDHPNLYYFIITDDKSYFKDVKRQNFFVNELKDFYTEFPEIGKYEYFISDSDKPYVNAEEYAFKFTSTQYVFPFSVMRFHLWQARKHGIVNVAMMCTDSRIKFDWLTDEHFKRKNILWNGMTQWPSTHEFMSVKFAESVIYSEYKLKNNDTYMVFDEACRLYVFESIDFMTDFFDMWNNTAHKLFKEDLMKHYKGGYVWHDEGTCAALCDVMGIKGGDMCQSVNALWDVKHNAKEERFWACYLNC